MTTIRNETMAEDLASYYVPAPMPLLSISSEETIQKCAALELRASDCFICSYPKSGTTWTQHIVLSLLFCHLSNKFPDHGIPPYNHVSDYAPFFEIDAHWQGNELSSSIIQRHTRIGRRIFNTHLRYNMLPSTGEGGKFIYIVRSPLDACVSFFNHLSNQVEGGYDKSFDDFFLAWMDGTIPFGSWTDHVMSYTPAFSIGQGAQVTQLDRRQFLLLSYEEMLDGLPAVLDKIVAFLDLDVTEEQRQELLPTFSFSHMKANLERFQPQSVNWKKNFSFLRRGVSGDSFSVLTDEQRALFRKWIFSSGFSTVLQNRLRRSNPEVYNRINSLLE